MAVAKLKRTSKKPAERMKIAPPNLARKKTEESRMNFRLSIDIKKRVARAAALAGQDLTEFAVATLSEKADAVLERHDNLLLGNEDYSFFLNVLTDTKISEPSKRSRAAAERYRQGTRKGARYVLAD